MTDLIADLFTQLEAAAADHDWMICQAALEQLLENLPTGEGVKLAAGELKIALIAFENLRPNIKWARQAVEIISKGTPLPDTFAFEPPVEGANPIINDFADALDLLDQAAVDQTKPHICAAWASKAIQGALNVRRYDYFATNYHLDWRIVVKREAGAENLPPLRSKFLREPDVEAYMGSMWLKLIGKLRKVTESSGT